MIAAGVVLLVEDNQRGCLAVPFATDKDACAWADEYELRLPGEVRGVAYVASPTSALEPRPAADATPLCVTCALAAGVDDDDLDMSGEPYSYSAEGTCARCGGARQGSVVFYLPDADLAEAAEAMAEWGEGPIYARLSAQGGAASETALCATHVDRADEHPMDTTFGDDPSSPYVDCSGNEALRCQVCGFRSPVEAQQ